MSSVPGPSGFFLCSSSTSVFFFGSSGTLSASSSSKTGLSFLTYSRATSVSVV